MENRDRVALYIHIPFCPSKCHYCSFAVITDHSLYQDYLTVLKEELRSTVKLIQEKGRRVHTIYFGGGTPSTLKIEDIKEILDIALIEKAITPLPTERSASKAEVRGVTHAQTSTALCSDQSIIEEISFEMNPEHVTKEYLADLKALGITRVSIGIQSLNNDVLEKAGRAHDANCARNALEILNASQIPYNVDLIMGLPGSNQKEFIAHLKEVMAFSPSHVSSYFLTIEPGTPFQRLPSTVFSNEHEQVETFEAMKKILKQDYGFSQYEISNWAKNHDQSEHNLMYWRGYEYLGVGLGAASFFENTRWSNMQNMKLYLQNTEKYNKKSREILSPLDLAQSYLMTALRLQEGIETSYVASLLDNEATTALLKNLSLLKDQGLLETTPHGFRITDSNRLLHNFIITSLL